MSGKRGGPQPGSGRPKGVPNKRTRELIAKATEEGISPMDVLLGDMRYFHSLAEKELAPIRGKENLEENLEAFKRAIGLKNIASERAKEVSPYVHAKLSSIDAKVSVSNQETALAELE